MLKIILLILMIPVKTEEAQGFHLPVVIPVNVR
jgi:hypothetical protein